MVMIRWVILGLALATLMGCASAPQVRHYGDQYPPTLPGEVEIFYSFPDREHVKIGAIDVEEYKPGFSDPSVYDAHEKIKEAGASLGAHAVVVINSHSTGERVIQVTGEAIRWPDEP